MQIKCLTMINNTLSFIYTFRYDKIDCLCEFCMITIITTLVCTCSGIKTISMNRVTMQKIPNLKDNNKQIIYIPWYTYKIPAIQYGIGKELSHLTFIEHIPYYICFEIFQSRQIESILICSRIIEEQLRESSYCRNSLWLRNYN